MKRKLTSVFASCVAVSLVFTAFSATVLAEEYEEPVYEEPVYEEPVYEEPVYEEPVYEEPVYEEPAPAERTLVSVNTYYDCDGSGNGYYEYVYSDGSMEYEDFYASSSESTYEEPVYEEPVYEEPVYEEPVYEEPVYEESTYEEPVYEEPAVEESTDVQSDEDKIEWTTDEIATIPDVVTGVDDKEYEANSASKYDIHMGVTSDSDIVRGVLFNTASIDFNTPGEYDVTYWVYFNRDALLEYMEENDIDAEDFPGLNDESEDRIEIVVNAKVTIE